MLGLNLFLSKQMNPNSRMNNPNIGRIVFPYSNTHDALKNVINANTRAVKDLTPSAELAAEAGTISNRKLRAKTAHDIPVKELIKIDTVICMCCVIFSFIVAWRGIYKMNMQNPMNTNVKK